MLRRNALATRPAYDRDYERQMNNPFIIGERNGNINHAFVNA
jgi:hypothetical protein